MVPCIRGAEWKCPTQSRGGSGYNWVLRESYSGEMVTELNSEGSEEGSQSIRNIPDKSAP